MDRSVLDGCEPQELTDAIGQLHALEGAVRRQMLVMVAVCDRRELWKQDGAASMAEWLCTHLGLSIRTALPLVEIARALEELPAIAADYEAGRLSWDKVAALVRFATPESDDALAQEAQGLNAAQVELAARRRRHITKEEDDEGHRRRSVWWRWSEDASYLRLSGRLPREQGAIVSTALERIAGQSPPATNGAFEPFESRAADALVELASCRLAADADADRATVVIHVDHDTLREQSGVAEVHGGGLLGAETTQRLICDARVQVAVDDASGKPVGLGRTTRTVPPWLARHLKHRDGGCRFPGCGRARFVDAHHVKHWTKGGPTDLDNLALLCRHHHRLVHEGGWQLRGRPDKGLRFIRPDGRELEARPPPLRPEVRRRILPGAGSSGGLTETCCRASPPASGLGATSPYPIEVPRTPPARRAPS